MRSLAVAGQTVSSGFTAEGIMILGAPRSGTTLLRRLLDAHPNIACPGETNLFRACGRFLRSERIAEGVRIGVLDGLAYAGFSRSEVLTRLREFAFSFHAEYAKRHGKPRWADKSPLDAFYLEDIEHLCGDALHFVCIQRHGLDVACSIQDLCEKNGGYLTELHEYIVRYPMMLEAFAHVWVDLARSIDAFAKRHPENAILVTYEELTARTDATMARIMDFVGEQWDPALIDRALENRRGLGLGDWKTYGRKSIDPSSVGRWRELSRDTISRLGTICNPTLALCGYDPIEIQTERTTDEARRRLEIGLLLQRLNTKSDGAAPEKVDPSSKRGRDRARNS
jgi:protein-tyrosine sulfotransferase